MDATLIARWQFAITTIYHFFFVPLTLGLVWLVALMQTRYYRTGDETWRRMTKFWGKLFLINFAIGVATGIVQEFQFGMNWSEYSRFVGDIFGAPLAIEALLTFFLESTFIGIWLFGWDRIPKGVHLLSIYLVAIGSTFSALWILIANSWMQQPVGYVINNGRAEMVDFLALIRNPQVWVQFPHVWFSGLVTAGVFMMGIAAWRLFRRDRDQAFFARSFQMGALAALIGSLLVMLVGHSQAQYMVRTQPMKMASAEALWESADPASMSLFTIGDLRNRRDVFAIRVPALLSVLAYNRAAGEVKGVNQLQAEYEQTYGPGNYMPFVPMIYWSFRAMVGAGLLMLLLASWGLLRMLRGRTTVPSTYLRWLPLALLLPYLTNSTGWILTEMGRQPWIVFGLQKTADTASPTVGIGAVLLTAFGFTALYGVLIVVDIYLMQKYARADTAEVAAGLIPSDEPPPAQGPFVVAP
jgi:cytochrome d ubiquinol oxidase subunit I